MSAISSPTAARLMRSSIDHATAPALYRSRRMSRKDRKAAMRVVWLVGLGLAYFVARSL